MKSHITDVSLFQQYLKDRRKLADSSINMYVSSIVKFLVTDPDLENLEDYNNFLIQYTVKKRCNHYYSILRAFIDFKIPDAATRKRLQDGMIKPPERNDIVRTRRYLTEEKILEVINYLDDYKHKVVALIQTLTGVRAGDIFRTHIGNILPEEYKGNPVLRLNLTGKGGKLYPVYIHDDVAQQMIMNYISTANNHEEYYFIELSSYKGRDKNYNDEFRLVKMNYQWYWADLKQALQTAGINREDFATHDFRRCFSRRVWEKYMDIHKLQNALNHADPRTTMRYLKHSGLQNIELHREMQE